MSSPPSSRGGDRRSQEVQGNNVTLIPPPEERGTSREYTVRRLKRDRPDLAELVQALATFSCLKFDRSNSGFRSRAWGT